MSVSFSNRGPELTGDVLAGVEQCLGIDLPADYQTFLLNHNGGEPYPAQFLCKIKDAAL